MRLLQRLPTRPLTQRVRLSALPSLGPHSMTSVCAAMTTETNSSSDNADIFNQLDTYPWDTDNEFQIGLSAILGSTSSPSQVRDLTLRARCFYLSRKKSVPIDFDAYKAHFLSKYPDDTLVKGDSAPQSTSQSLENSNRQAKPDDASANPTEGDAASKDAPYPSSFAEIVALITAGKPIPGIREIPPTVLEDQATKPAASKRRKPWEKESEDVNVEEGTFGDKRDFVLEQDVPDA
ncbi:hypothetical protein DH86_00004059 [Scytalidium sp. 3C]|nr:hypothetical protein DH86_00004059 [Scytalidium sp. 3C]